MMRILARLRARLFPPMTPAQAELLVLVKFPCC
jgi:hypothetical protein